MNRTIAILVCLILSLPAAAQLRFGVIGGASFTGSTAVEAKSVTRYHAGVTMQYRSVLGFGIQPSLLYHCKDASADNLQTGYLELPISLQWGPDLILFRPYLEVTPLVGVAVNSRIDSSMLKRLEYGVGVGGGIDVWRLQISARYNWDLGPYSSGSQSGCYRYATLSLAVLF